jgi:hypothetical protein
MNDRSAGRDMNLGLTEHEEEYHTRKHAQLYLPFSTELGSRDVEIVKHYLISAEEATG